jgi:hydroxymethylbilane synthase
MNHPLIIGTRASKMARCIAEHFKNLLEEAHPQCDVSIAEYLSTGCKTPGDLRALGGKGAFVKDLEQRLLDKEIDCAVHCLKDIPGDEPMHPDLELFCFLTREDPRDALIMRPGLSEPTPDQKVVLATTSPRRQAILRKLYPAAEIIPLRGNVDTRFQKLHDGQFDGMVLSYAGLQRLNLENHVTKIYDPKDMLPAIGQGILVMQVRKEDAQRCQYLRSLNSEITEKIVQAERTMLMQLQGDCYSAIAGLCEQTTEGLVMRGMVASVDGNTILEAHAIQSATDTPSDLGKRIAEQLLQLGAREIIDTQH